MHREGGVGANEAHGEGGFGALARRTGGGGGVGANEVHGGRFGARGGFGANEAHMGGGGLALTRRGGGLALTRRAPSPICASYNEAHSLSTHSRTTSQPHHKKWEEYYSSG